MVAHWRAVCSPVGYDAPVSNWNLSGFFSLFGVVKCTCIKYRCYPSLFHLTGGLWPQLWPYGAAYTFLWNGSFTYNFHTLPQRLSICLSHNDHQVFAFILLRISTTAARVGAVIRLVIMTAPASFVLLHEDEGVQQAVDGWQLLKYPLHSPAWSREFLSKRLLSLRAFLLAGVLVVLFTSCDLVMRSMSSCTISSSKFIMSTLSLPSLSCRKSPWIQSHPP